jgi:hypothetical protein
MLYSLILAGLRACSVSFLLAELVLMYVFTTPIPYTPVLNTIIRPFLRYSKRKVTITLLVTLLLEHNTASLLTSH